MSLVFTLKIKNITKVCQTFNGSKIRQSEYVIACVKVGTRAKIILMCENKNNYCPTSLSVLVFYYYSVTAERVSSFLCCMDNNYVLLSLKILPS